MGWIGVLMFMWHERLLSLRAGNDRKKKSLLPVTVLCSNGKIKVGAKLFSPFIFLFVRWGCVCYSGNWSKKFLLCFSLWSTWVHLEGLDFFQFGRLGKIAAVNISICHSWGKYKMFCDQRLRWLHEGRGKMGCWKVGEFGFCQRKELCNGLIHWGIVQTVGSAAVLGVLQAVTVVTEAVLASYNGWSSLREENNFLHFWAVHQCSAGVTGKS